MSKFLKLLNIGEFNSLNNRLPLVAGMMDNRDLSKLSSGKAKPQLLAFFVPKFWKASQATQDKDTTHLTQFTGLIRHIMPALANSYGGVTLQNIKAIRRICEAVATKTESEPRHPMNFHSVVLTQNLVGGYHA